MICFFFVVLCELDMLNKVLQHLISLPLDTPLPVVVVPWPKEVSDKMHF